MAPESKARQPPPRLAAAATSGAAAPPSPSSESQLAAALRDEAGIGTGVLPGVYHSADDGHASCPWRSGIRREGFEHVKGGRHASEAEASLRILEAYQAHPAYVDSPHTRDARENCLFGRHYTSLSIF